MPGRRGNAEAGRVFAVQLRGRDGFARAGDGALKDVLAPGVKHVVAPFTEVRRYKCVLAA
jgi:hypothetical protein